MNSVISHLRHYSSAAYDREHIISKPDNPSTDNRGYTPCRRASDPCLDVTLTYTKQNVTITINPKLLKAL
jgi:hypothetical protein